MSHPAAQKILPSRTRDAIAVASWHAPCILPLARKRCAGRPIRERVWHRPLDDALWQQTGSLAEGPARLAVWREPFSQALQSVPSVLIWVVARASQAKRPGIARIVPAVPAPDHASAVPEQVAAVDCAQALRG